MLCLLNPIVTASASFISRIIVSPDASSTIRPPAFVLPEENPDPDALMTSSVPSNTRWSSEIVKFLNGPALSKTISSDSLLKTTSEDASSSKGAFFSVIVSILNSVHIDSGDTTKV